YQAIDPYPLAVTERVERLNYQFQTADDWVAVNDAKIKLAKKNSRHYLEIESTGGDPYLHSPSITKLLADAKQPQITGSFEIELSMSLDHITNGQLFWTSTNSPAWNEANSVRFSIDKANENRKYILRGNADGELTGFRLDPCSEEGHAVLSGFSLRQIVYQSPDKKVKPVPFIAETFELEGETKSITNVDKSLRFEFQTDGGAAMLYRNEKKVAVVAPLVSYDDNLPIAGELPTTARRRAKLKLKDFDNGTCFFTDETDKKDYLYLIFSFVVNDTLSYRLKADNVHGPIFRPLGTMEQALLPGVEYLERGEWSSSTADIETAEHVRYSPKLLQVTMQFTAIATDKVTLAMLYNKPRNYPIFATPNFLDADPKGHRLNIYSGSEQNVHVRITGAWSDTNRIENAIEWAVKTADERGGLPPLPQRPRSADEQRQLNLDGLTKSKIFAPDRGWKHAYIPGNPAFPHTFGSDYASTIWQITGKLPETPYISFGGSHLENSAAFFLVGKAAEWHDVMMNRSAELRRSQKEDGSFEYNGKYNKGHREKTASGLGGYKTLQLWELWRRLGQTECRDAAIRGTEALKRFRTPRGAQTWELSLHTPDIMASAWCTLAFLYAYEETGNKEYLDLSRRWALSGLPFVYQWQDPKCPVMLYATTPVFGATSWIAPNWIGLPVQWCGLDYAEALLSLSEHDKTFDWRKLAEGILISAEQQQYPSGESIGLLPDSFTLSTQRRNPADISPVVLERLRRRLENKLPDLAVVVSEDKKNRIVSPFPAKIEGTKVTINATKGQSYHVLLNNKTVEITDSAGEDVLDF
ncbi:MAG: hypothetical protein LBU65_16475, partial [Planctomycetaceae bacterium]|nr:hypothetical protein [Planctomycetaceae bacterium]